MTAVKICGIKTAEQAIGAAEAGADYIGLVFAPSPRQVTPAQSKTIVAELKERAKKAPQVVGVFVNAPASLVNSIADVCRLDWVQLSGEETYEYCRELNRPFIKVVRVARKYKKEQLEAILEGGEKALAGLKRIFMLDSYEKEKFGGTGKSFNWEPAREVFGKYQLMLAGGLTPENAGEAVRALRPWGVDVSSGVETEGVKDMDKIRKFIKAVRDAE